MSPLKLVLAYDSGEEGSERLSNELKALLPESTQITVIDLAGRNMSKDPAPSLRSDSRPMLLCTPYSGDLLKRIRAMEFAARCDDGRGEEHLADADLVLLGATRTGKTPLSFYLAQKGLMTANLTLVPEREPPEALGRVAPEKVVGLDMSTECLSLIRAERLRMLGLEPKASAYADIDRVERELNNAREYYRASGYRVCDMTNRSIEEGAHEIHDYIRTANE